MRAALMLSSQHDPYLFYGEDVICLAYVDDCIFFAKDYEAIDRLLQKLKDHKLKFTLEEDVHAFMGVEIERYSNRRKERTKKAYQQDSKNHKYRIFQFQGYSRKYCAIRN